MFTWFDIIIFAILTASSLFGIYGGIIKLTIGLLGFIFSIICTVYLYPYTHEIMANYVVSVIPLTIISGVISYLISLIIFSIITHKLLITSATIRGGVIDRFLGLIAGFGRGILICLLLFVSAAVIFSGSYLEAKTLKDIVENTTIDKYPKWLQDSITTPYLDQLSKDCINTIPGTDLESTKLPNKLNTNFKDVLEKSHPKPTTTIDKNTNILEELDHNLKEIIPKEQDN